MLRSCQRVGPLAMALYLAFAASAHSSVATDVRAELVAAGVPSPVVSVVTPSAASAADLAAYDADPGISLPSITPENLMSPDPTQPLPVIQVSWSKGTVSPLPGVPATPALADWYTVEDAEFPVWRLQIMSAMKHVLARGSSVAGVAMAPSFPNRAGAGSPDFYATPPDLEDLPPTSLPQTMPTGVAEASIRTELPAWAQLADVRVVDWAGGERRATVSLTTTALQLAQLNPQDLVLYLMHRQRALNTDGANIGSFVVRLKGPFGDPLFTFAGDATWGQYFMWTSPLVRAFVPGPTRASPSAIPG